MPSPRYDPFYTEGTLEPTLPDPSGAPVNWKSVRRRQERKTRVKIDL